MDQELATKEPLTDWVSDLRGGAGGDAPATAPPPGASGPRTGQQPADQTGEQPADQTGQQPAYRTGEQPAYRTGEQPAYRTDQQPAYRPSRSGPPGPAQHRESDAPELYDQSGRLFFHIVFWCALATSVELWWLNTPAHSISSVADILVAGGRLTGMIGGFLLLAQVLLMSRVRWLERWIGAHSLLIWHRELGGALLIMILAHVGLIVVGYNQASDKALLPYAWTMITTYEDMVSATIATGILVAVGLLAIRTIRRAMPYELWYYLHLTSYLVLLLSYGHQFATGRELSVAGFGQYYWAGLYVFVVVCLIWGRLLGPAVFNLRHRLRVERVVDEGSDMISIYVGGRRLEDLNARAGQYFRWRFLTPGCWWQAHPFSLSAAPNERFLRLTIKVVGDHTEQLRTMRPGAKVFVEGPSGVFTADRRRRPRALLIAGGSGIAPIRALLEDLPPLTVVIYRARSEAELVFRKELDFLAQQREAQVWYVLGSRDDPAPQHLFTAKGMRELVPDVRHRDVFLCGPQGLVDTSVRALRRLRVPRRQIHLDPFEF